MTILTPEQIKERYGPSKKEVEDFLRKHHVPRNQWRSKYAKTASRLKAAKIRKDVGGEATIRSEVGEYQIIYGRARVAGVITFAHIGANNEHLHLVVTFAGHEVDAIEELYLDGEKVIFGASPDPRWSTDIQRIDGSVAPALNRVFMSPSLGFENQTGNTDLIGQLPSLWTTNHKQRGCAHAYIILKWDTLIFPDGNVPDIEAVIRGKKCFDPRTSTTVWTSNPALIAADYLMDTKLGLGCASSEIDMNYLSAAANVCDESVTLVGGGTEARYVVNGVFKSSDSSEEFLQSIEASMAGNITYVGGVWKIYPGTWRSPTWTVSGEGTGTALSLNENDILSEIKVQTRQSRRDTFNGVKGTFISPDHRYEEIEFPPYKNDFYKSQDNNERIWEDVQLPYSTSPSRCQRIAKIAVEESRQGITVELTASLKALTAEVCENMYLSISRFGWVNKLFEIQESEVVIDSDANGSPRLGVALYLRETASGIYSWNNGEETNFDLAPNTTLPNPFSVTTPVGLVLTSGTNELYIRNDGTVFTRIKVAWDTMTDFFVTSGGRIEIQYKKTSDTLWNTATPVDGDQTFTHILDVQDGVRYDVRVAAVSAAGIKSHWNYVLNYLVIGKTEPPSQVSGFKGEVTEFGIRLSWNQVPDLDVAEYEIRLGTVGQTWATANFLALVRGTTYASEIKLAASYRYFIKAKDTSGNYSLVASELSAIITAPNPPVTTFEILGIDILFRWTKPTSLFAIDLYEIRESIVTENNPNPTFESSTIVVTTKSTTYRARVSFSGTRYFWVTARDIAGNTSTPYLVVITIKPPGAVVGLKGEVIDNNILLRWSASTAGTLPIERYQVYKGNTFPTSVLVGEVAGTFAAIFESVGGDFTYWVVGVDSARNISSPVAVVLRVSEPPDFILRKNGVVDPKNATMGENIYIEGFGFLAGTAGSGGQGSPLGGFLLTITQAEPPLPGPGGTGASLGGMLLTITKA